MLSCTETGKKSSYTLTNCLWSDNSLSCFCGQNDYFCSLSKNVFFRVNNCLIIFHLLNFFMYISLNSFHTSQQSLTIISAWSNCHEISFSLFFLWDFTSGTLYPSFSVSISWSLSNLLLFVFGQVACGILVPWPGTEPTPSVVEAQF